MPANKGKSKSVSLARQPATNVNNTVPRSATDSPHTPQEEKRTPYRNQVNRAISRTAQPNTATAGTMSPSTSAHSSPLRAGPSGYGDAQLSPQAKQPLQMFGSHCSGYQDNPAVSAMFNSAYSSTESSHGFGALGQRPDHALNIENHQAQNFQNYQAKSFPNHQAQNVQNPLAHIQNYYQAQNMHCYQAQPQAGNSEQYCQLAEFDPRSQQYKISMKHNDTADDTQSQYAAYTRDGVYLGPKHLPGGHTITSGTPSNPSSGFANITHPGIGHHEALVPTTQATDAPEPAEFETYSQISQELQDRVNVLVQQNGETDYGGYILNDNDAAEYEQAVWNAKTRGKTGYDQKCDDYPWDEAGQREARQRLFEAIVNLGGEQDRVSDNGIFVTSLAVRIIRSMSPVEIELAVHRLLVAMRSAQAGVPMAPGDVKIVQEDNFAGKLDAVVEVLSINKSLCKSVIEDPKHLALIAADPAGERKKKIRNNKNNMTKSTILSEANKKKGTSRKVKGKGKGQGKRPADAGSEAEAEPGSSAEAVDEETAQASVATA